MNLKTKLLLTIVVLLGNIMLVGQSPRTFYVGHSLSDQIPDMVQSLSNDLDDLDFSWVYQSIPGAPLRWQWVGRRKQLKQIKLSHLDFTLANAQLLQKIDQH